MFPEFWFKRIENSIVGMFLYGSPLTKIPGEGLLGLNQINALTACS
jgi:hypothetical protein